MSALWFVPICDQVMGKIMRWYVVYDQGEVFATREAINLDGDKVEVPTKRAQVLSFKPLEVQHLVRILETLEPKSHLTADFKRIQAGLKRGRLRPGGEYEVRLAFYKQDVRDLIEILYRAKTGQLKKLEDLVAEQKQQGKDPFEV